VSLVANLHAKFEVSSSNRSRDMEGVPKFEKRSRDPFTISVYGVGGDLIFGYLNPDLPIHYTTFVELRRRLRVVYG